MKKLLFASLLLISVNARSQTTATLDKQGNYIATSKPKQTGSQAKPTGKTFTDTKGVIYPVLESKNGKLFYVKTSKTGNVYNVYIKVN